MGARGTENLIEMRKRKARLVDANKCIVRF